MNLDFRKLGYNDQVKALDNLYRLENGHNGYFAHLLAKEQYDVYAWFALSQSIEGSEYWFNLKDEMDEKV
jgi:hypothetical protein